LHELRDVCQTPCVRLENRAVGLAEAERVEVIERARPVDVEQKSARVDAVAAA